MFEDDKDYSIFETVYAIEVFTNVQGNVTLKQLDALDEEQIIVVPKQHVKALIKALREAARGERK